MAVNVVQNALASRRFSRWLFVLAAVVLAAGIIAIIATRGGSSSSSAPAENANPTGPTISGLEEAQKNIRFPAAAWKVAQKFIYTAVSRRNLA